MLSARSEAIRDEPLRVVSTVVGNLVHGRVLAPGRALVAAVSSLVGQTAQCDEGKAAVDSELNLPTGICPVEGVQLSV